MKKIVALALCLVLALSLCATAFALDAKGLYAYDPTTDAVVNTKLATLTYVAAKEATASVDGNLAYYKAENGDKYVVEDKADATFVMYTGTGYIYLASGTNVAAYSVNPGYVFAYKCPISATCGKVTKNPGVVEFMFTKVNGAGKTEYFEAVKATGAATVGTEINVAVDGVVYTIKTTPSATAAQPHTWTVATSNATTGVAETVVCTACGTKGTVVSSAVYLAAPAAQQAAATPGFPCVLVDAAASTTTSTVSSAKTFDAGIAMYVGMSIMAVTGSAVVIGKKKEF